MRKISVTIIFLLLGLVVHGQTDSIRGRQFQLTGKLVGQIQLPPHCGVKAWATVLQFEIIAIEGLAYKNNSIGIIVPCPERGGDFFKEGRLYQIIFSDTNQADFNWTILNQDLLKNNHLAFDPYAISIKRAP